MKTKLMIQEEDFLSASVHITLRNLVSQTVIDSKVKTIGNVKLGPASELNRIQLVEVMPSGFILSVPRCTCAVGHSLEIKMVVTDLGDAPMKTVVLGKVKHSERVDESHDRIEIELKSASEPTWRAFCGLFSSRQESIDDFFTSVKGY